MKKNILIIDILSVLLVSISFVSLFLFVFEVFNVSISIILATILTLLAFWVTNTSFKLDLNMFNSKHLFPILILLLIGLLFRSDPYHYMVGGQDEGVYVNMSKYYENYGKPFIIDEFRKNLPEELKSVYDSNNLIIETRKSIKVSGQKEGSYLPGVYVKNQHESEYVFQFYPLHPLWMSLFGKTFGDENRVYSLVFFSLLSIVSFYLLAFEFTKNKYIAFTSGFLLAVNPLHAFFSKFPVTEIVALTFTTLSFYYLLKYYNLAKEKNYYTFYLILSSLLIAGMFYTRISGFMYIPFFYLILLLTQLFIANPILKKHLKLYVFSIFILYGTSVWYGLVFSYPYSSDIYRLSFSRALGGQWQIALPVLLSFLVCFYFVVSYISQKNYAYKVRIFINEFRKYIPYIFLFILSIGMYKVYLLGFTDTFDAHKSYDLRWHVAGTEWHAFLHSSIVVLFEYLSPFILVLFSYLLFIQIRKNNTEQTLLIVFVLLFFIHISLLQWFVPYQYYYARYLLSEIMPFLLLFTIIGLAKPIKYNKIAYFLVGCSAVYMLFFTSIQFKGKEMDGLHTSLSEINKYVGPDDIIILNQRVLHTAGELKTALRFYYDYNILTASDNDQVELLDYFCEQKKNIYFFNLQEKDKYSDLIKSIKVKAEIFEHTNHIPMAVVHISKQYFLSKVSCHTYNQKKMRLGYILYEKNFALGRKFNFHTDGVWTKGTAYLTNINTEVDDNKLLVLETFGYHPYRNAMNKLELKILMNGHDLVFLKQEKNNYYFEIPDIDEVIDLKILSNTFIPKMLKINNDTRSLGIDLKMIKLVKG